MPLPWKKSKIGRVSRFVSDLKSSKHGGSLVVETGFPTSLVDLMIKNRDRLRKPSKKKKHSFEISDSSSSVLPHPHSLSPPLPSSNSSMLMVPSSPSSIKTLIKKNHVSYNDDDKIVEISSTSPPKKRTFMLILKLLFILILGFGTKKIALMITVTAFVLFLVEIVCKNLCSYWKPCQDARENLISVVDSVLDSAHSQIEETGPHKKNDDNSLVENEEILVGENFGLIEVEDDNNREKNNGALIIAKNEANMNEEIQLEPGFDSLYCGCRWGFFESDQKKKLIMKQDEVTNEDPNMKGLKKRSSVKFHSKMLKKFVPKFRGSKRKKKRNNNKETYLDSSSEFVSNSMEEDENVINRAEEDEDDDDDEQEEPDEGEDDEEDEVTSGDFSQIELETEFDLRKKITWNSQQLIPFVIILTGLIGGRLMGLVLNLIWCLLVTSKTRIMKKTQ